MSSGISTFLARARLREVHFAGPASVVPSSGIAIVTCMDSRIDTFRIFGLQNGEAHVLRNAGGLVTDDTLRSLVLSQHLLRTREVLLMSHTGCALHGASESELRAKLEAESGGAPPYAFGAFADLDDAMRVAVRRVREHPFLLHRDAVRGFVYDVETGRLREVVT